MQRHTTGHNDPIDASAAQRAEASDRAPAPMPRRRVLRLLPGLAFAASTMLVLAGCGGEGDDEEEEDDD